MAKNKYQKLAPRFPTSWTKADASLIRSDSWNNTRYLYKNTLYHIGSSSFVVDAKESMMDKQTILKPFHPV